MPGAVSDALPEGMSEDYSDATSTLGDRITLAREALGLEQEDVAAQLGVTLRTFRNWEDNRAEPRANKVQMLAGMLNVSMIWLMSGRGDQPSFVGDGTGRIVAECLDELRVLLVEQRQLAERIHHVERRLRLAFDG
jgi:HTH-type transcriptional regulator, cell division transcriptional repressor